MRKQESPLGEITATEKIYLKKNFELKIKSIHPSIYVNIFIMVKYNVQYFKNS